jgi:hypothetical protein
MTVQDKHEERIEQGASVPNWLALTATAYLEIVTDADLRIRRAKCKEPTVAELIDAYLHDVCGIDRAVTKLVDPVDYYLYITTSPGER